jgi:hypothetical protein
VVNRSERPPLKIGGREGGGRGPALRRERARPTHYFNE